ncbi:flavin reductase family protein [Halobacteriales archaeon Cl-PHB]
MHVDPESHDDMYRTVSSLVVPRPIAWVSSRSADGVDNLAPYSFFQVVNEKSPPVLMVSPEETADGTLKDSPRNATDTSEFVVNIAAEDQADLVDATSEDHQPDVDEFERYDVPAVEADVVDALRVRDAVASFECTLYETMDLNDHLVVFGHVERIHVDDAVVSDGRVDAEAVRVLGRLGGGNYTDTEPLVRD